MRRYALPKYEANRPWRGWYNTARWKQRRALQLQTEPLCRYCQEIGGDVTPATVADHIEPHRGDYDLFYYGALQSLCATCHSGMKQELERTGRMRGHDAKGHPLKPPPHWR